MSTSRKRRSLKIFAVTAVALMFLSGVYLVNDIEETEGTAYSYTAYTMFSSSTTDYYFKVGDTLTLTHENVFLYEDYDEEGDYFEVWRMYMVYQPNTDLTNWTSESHTIVINYQGTPRTTKMNCYQLNSVVLNNAGDFEIKLIHFYSQGYANGTGLNNTKTITIHVQPSYTVSFSSSNTSHGTVDKTSVTVPSGTSLTKSSNKVTVSGTTCTATAKTITGYTTQFSKWQYSTNNSNWSDLGNSLTINSNVWIKAVFTSTINSYTVTYKNGSSTIHTETVQYNGTITHTTHSISGKLFCGWYTDSNFATAFNTSTKITANRTLFGYFVDPLAFTSSPVANATITYASGLGSILFDALKSESAAKVLWDFGDGTYGDEIVMYHHYEEPGTYNVLLSVFNSNNDVDTREYVVTVYDAAYPPEKSDNTLLIAGIVMVALTVGFIIARPF